MSEELARTYKIIPGTVGFRIERDIKFKPESVDERYGKSVSDDCHFSNIADLVSWLQFELDYQPEVGA